MLLRRYRIRTGTETKEERKTRENVIYTTAITISNILKQRLEYKKNNNRNLALININELTRLFSVYIYKFLTTHYIRDNFNYNPSNCNDSVFEYLSQIIKNEDDVNIIKFYSRYSTHVRSSGYMKVYVGKKEIELLSKPIDDQSYPNIKENCDPFLNGFEQDTY